jgi:hypothetical protein
VARPFFLVIMNISHSTLTNVNWGMFSADITLEILDVGGGSGAECDLARLRKAITTESHKVKCVNP